MKEFDETEAMNEDEATNIITLTDEEGNDVDFEFLDLIEYEGNEYVILLPVEEDSDEVVILQVEVTEDDEEIYTNIEDEDVLMAVFELFKDKYKDEFDFGDEA